MPTFPYLDPNNALKSAIDILNEAYQADPAAIHALMVNQVPCNQALIDHPLVQVKANLVAKGETYSVGTLGVINAVVQCITGEKIAIAFSEPDDDGRCRMIGFVKYQSLVSEL